MTKTEHLPFLQAILEFPDQDEPRLVYADKLDEEGDPRGEFIRVQCQLAKLQPRQVFTDSDSFSFSHGSGSVDAYRGNPVSVGDRIDIVLNEEERNLSYEAGERKIKLRPFKKNWHGLFVESVRSGRLADGGIYHHVEFTIDEKSVPSEYGRLKEREQTLLNKQNEQEWRGPILGFRVPKSARPGRFGHYEIDCQFQRGFVNSITCAGADWLKHADALTWCWPKCQRCMGKDGRYDDLSVDLANRTVCYYCNGQGRVPPTTECTAGVCHGTGDETSDGQGTCSACKGVGRIPRPCPPTVQFITKVTLTTTLQYSPVYSGVIRLTANSVQYDCTNVIYRQWMDQSEPVGRINNHILQAEWPGITFKFITN